MKTIYKILFQIDTIYAINSYGNGAKTMGSCPLTMWPGLGSSGWNIK